MAKKDYWQERVRAQQAKEYDAEQEQLQKELRRAYQGTAEMLRDEIIKVWAKVEDGKAKGQPLQINDFYRNNRYWALLNRINDLLKDLGGKQINITVPALVRLYEQSMAAVSAEAPIGLVQRSFVVPDAVDATQRVVQAWAADGKDFSSRVWEDKAKMLELLKRGLESNITAQRGPWETAAKLMDTLGVSEHNAYRLARTEGAHAQVMGAARRYKEMGFTRGKFVAAPGCCDECQKRDGETFPLEQVYSALPAHPNCRCSFSAAP